MSETTARICDLGLPKAPRLRPPTDPHDAVARTRLIERAIKMRDDIRFQFDSIDHWNRVHPDEDPINPDPDGQLAQLLHSLDRMIARNVE